MSRAQILATGVSSRTLSRWVRDGRLHRIHPSVYAAGHAALRPRGWRRAAVLACGAGAVLAVRFSACEWGTVRPPSGRVDVIPPRRGGTGIAGIRSHRVTLDPEDTAICDGMPVTSLGRTFLDVAADGASERYVSSMIDQAIALSLFDSRSVAASIDRAHGHRGLGTLLPILEKIDGARFRSGTEHVVRDRLVAAGVPRALVNGDVEAGGRTYELDLLWRRERLNVEIDGPQHELPLQRTADADRDAALRAAGYRVLRVPARLVDDDPDAVVALIAAALGPSSI